MVTTQPPSTITAGVPFSLVVAAEDGDGNVDATYSGNVTVYNVLVAGPLGGTTTVTAANGVATFSGLTLAYATSSTLCTPTPTAFVELHQQFHRDPRGGDAAWHSLRRQRGRRRRRSALGRCA